MSEIMRGPRPSHGVTLLEVLIASVMFIIVAVGAVQAIFTFTVLDKHSEEEAIVASFMHDYLENVRFLRYEFKDGQWTNDLVPGRSLPDGARAFPASDQMDTWLAMTTTDLLYYPELAKLVRYGTGGQPIYPEYKVQITAYDDPLNGSGEDYRAVTLSVRWHPAARYARGDTAWAERSLTVRKYAAFDY